MGMIIINPTPEELCDLMCGKPEEDEEWVEEHRKPEEDLAVK